ncbi:BNR-4 repeat-containing protein [Aeoliella sp.]|uniref:BNR-4 repeat-containing protein n=1 Tax=Aeoliella sp. TaxID=2795800 RepID=UPI003CCC2F9E
MNTINVSQSRYAFWLLTPLAQVSLWAGVAQSQPAPLGFVQQVPITDNNAATNELGRDRVSINSTPFKNQSVITVGNYQFTPYYRDDGRLLIARRDLTDVTNTWDIRATQFTSFNINDAHNVPSFGIDGDGYLHISWGMHNNNLLYTKSTTPVTSGGPMAFVGDTVGNSAAINTMTGSHETSVTYPNFYSIPGTDNLLFNYRTGSSGNGIYRISHYDTSTDTWSFTDEEWIERTDSRGHTYNAYPHNLSYDSSGGLHASWTFRYNGSSPTGHTGYQTNHNLMYAYSPDNGVTWYRDIQGTIPYTGVIDDLTAEVAVPIPEGSSLINTGIQAIDTHGRPAIATWWAPRAQDPTPDHRRQYMFVGHDGTDWFTSQLGHRLTDNPNSAVPESQLGINHMGRPQLVFDDYNRAYVIFKDADRGGVVTVAYSQAESRDDWEFIDLTDTNLGYYEPTIDLALWESSRQLHVLVQTIDGSSGNGGSQMSILEWDAAAAMGRVLKWTGQNSATWDASTVNFADLGTPDSFAAFDNVTFDDSSAQTEVHFPAAVNVGKVVVDSTQTYMFSGPGSLTSGSLSVVGGGTLVLATSGNTYAGPTRVSNATLEITGDSTAMTSTIIAADGGTVVMDATNADTMASQFEVWPTGLLQIGTPTSTGNVFPTAPSGIYNDGRVRVLQNAMLQNVSGAGRLELAAATTTLSANASFDGVISIESGAVGVATDPSGLGSTNARVRIADGGRLEVATAGTLPPSLELAGDGGGSGALSIQDGHEVTVNGTVTLLATSAVNVASGASATFSVPVSGTGGIIKQGPGVMRLAGANTYVGPTVVRDGTLVVDSVTGIRDTTIESGGVLETGGTLRGNLVTESGATVRVVPYAGAQLGTVYEERFTGSNAEPLNGRAPDTVSSGATWVAHSSITSDGVGISIGGGSSATLPQTIEDGFRYVLDAAFQNASGDNDWFALGFLEDVMSGGTGNANRFISEPTAAKAWMLFRGDNSSDPNQVLLGSATSGTASSASWPTLNNSGGDIHMRVVLDTTGGSGNYTAEFFAKLPSDIDYTPLAGPLNLISEDISAVGFAVSSNDVVGDIDYFRLVVDADTPQDPLAMTIEGDFTLAAGATLELDLFSVNEYERVHVDGSIYAAGTIAVQLDGAAESLSSGDEFDLLDFDGLFGDMESLILPALSEGLVWDNSLFLSDGVLSVTTGLSGDFNGDNMVNLADYTVWRNTLGSTGAGLAADANGDLHVNQLDYLAWKSQFGETLSVETFTGANVPEPSTLTAGALMCLCLLAPRLARREFR